MTHDEIIAELRHRAGKSGGDAVLAEAADRIERLTSVAAAEMKLREGTFATIEALQAEVALLKRSRLMDDNEAVSDLTDVLHAAELIAALRADYAGACKTSAAALDECAALRAEVESLSLALKAANDGGLRDRAEAECLDFMERHKLAQDYYCWRDQPWEVFNEHKSWSGKTLRDAIDAAMKEGK